MTEVTFSKHDAHLRRSDLVISLSSRYEQRDSPLASDIKDSESQIVQDETSLADTRRLASQAQYIVGCWLVAWSE